MPVNGWHPARPAAGGGPMPTAFLKAAAAAPPRPLPAWSRRLGRGPRSLSFPAAVCRAASLHTRTLPCLPCLPAESTAITAATDAAAEEYSAGKQDLEEQLAVVRAAMQQPQHCVHFLRPGRIVRVTEGGPGRGE